MIIIDDDGIMHKVVPMSVIEDIKAEINELYTNARKAEICEQMGLKIALDVIDRHRKGANE